DSSGRVIEKNLLVTRIQTAKNEGITIPNGAVLAGAVKNFSELTGSEGLILHTNVSIGYEVDWRRVQGLLLSAAAKTSHVLGEPRPFVRQESLDDFFVTYELNAYTDEPSMMSATYSELHQNVLEAFNQAEVEILSPHYRAMRYESPATIPGRARTDPSEDGSA
ncbi:MAG: mechanosensitive ion channel family protein, partial [Gemmatimonadota bacterium]